MGGRSPPLSPPPPRPDPSCQQEIPFNLLTVTLLSVMQPERLKHALRHVRHRKRERMVQGYVYLMQCNELTKIGFSDKPKLRLAQIQAGCPYEVTLLRYVFTYDAEGLELSLHRILRRFHHRGEWFILPQVLIDQLLNLTDQQFRRIKQ